jgi:MFS transporter, PAT family, beta-lactamase induction signal transducer AmpG
MVHRAPRTFIWMLLTLPWGISSGFVLVTLSFLATRNGLSITAGALLPGALLLPWCLQALWTPAVDLTLTYRRWYLVATFGIALLTFAMAAVPLSPRTFSLFLVMVTAVGVLDTAIYVTVPAMMKLTARPEHYGRASAWSQIGHMGGIGLGGGLGLYLMRTLPAGWMAGLTLAAVCLVCCAVLPRLPAPANSKGESVAAAMKQVPIDMWRMIKAPAGFLCTLLGSLPFATGAAAPLLAQSTIAMHWGADAGVVELVQGALASVATSLGCLAGGWLSEHVRPRTSFIAAGLSLGVIAAVMAAAPANVDVYVAGMTLYAFATGACYAAYGPVMLDAMDTESLSSKIGLLGSLGFFPVWWVGLVMARVADDYGVREALLTEAALSAVSILAIFAVTRAMRRVPAFAANSLDNTGETGGKISLTQSERISWQ